MQALGREIRGGSARQGRAAALMGGVRQGMGAGPQRREYEYEVRIQKYHSLASMHPPEHTCPRIMRVERIRVIRERERRRMMRARPPQARNRP